MSQINNDLLQRYLQSSNLNNTLNNKVGLNNIQKLMLTINDNGIEDDKNNINPNQYNPNILQSLQTAYNNKPIKKYDKTDIINSLLPNGVVKLDALKMNKWENLAKYIQQQQQNQNNISQDSEQDLFNKILSYNKELGNRTDILHGARTATNLGVLLNNILQPEGDSLPTQINLTRPDIQYDDTLRRRMISEAGQQSNIAQMNAMKLGMNEAIPAISSNMMRATNDANTQAQANMNEIQQKNAMLASEIANKEIEANLTLNEKRIQDALMKNELRNKAVSGQTDTTFRDLGVWQQQREAIKQENMKYDVFKYVSKNPNGLMNNLLLQQFGEESFNRNNKKSNYNDDIVQQFREFLEKNNPNNNN